MRWLVWLLLGLLVYLALRTKALRNRNKMRDQFREQFYNAANRENFGKDSSVSAPAEKMVKCAHCQVYLPSSEAVHVASCDDYFCSEEHARLHSKAAPDI